MWAAYFARDYHGAPFLIFSLAHILALTCVVIFCAVLAVILWRGPAHHTAWRDGLAWFAIANLVVWYAWEWSVGLSSLAYSLPLQVCTAATLLCPIMLWGRNKRVFEVVYFWGVAGATQALLTPDIGQYGWPHVVFITFFTSHGAILASVVYMLVAERMRPSWASLGRVVLITLGFMLLAGLANALVGGNYMYLAWKPPSPTVIDVLGPWPWYIAGMIALGLLAFVIVYLPFAFSDWRQHQSPHSLPGKPG